MYVLVHNAFWNNILCIFFVCIDNPAECNSLDKLILLIILAQCSTSLSNESWKQNTNFLANWFYFFNSIPKLYINLYWLNYLTVFFEIKNKTWIFHNYEYEKANNILDMAINLTRSSSHLITIFLFLSSHLALHLLYNSLTGKRKSVQQNTNPWQNNIPQNKY